MLIETFDRAMEAQVLDVINYKTSWLCEKWSEEAVDFARRKLSAEGITHVRSCYVQAPVGVFRRGVARALNLDAPTRARMGYMNIKDGVSSEVLRRFVCPAEEVVAIEGNLMLNEGIARALSLIIAGGGTAYNNASSFIGVGDTSTAEAATQTELLATAAATNRFYKAMNATYPTAPASQTVDWQSDFASTEANFAWNEWTIAAGATTASGSGFLVGTTNLNRKVASLGTKSTGVWTLTGSVTLS